MVKGYQHDGREGRLAVVKDGATHYFLLLNFERMQKARMWIGLTAECREKAELSWIDETPLAETNFRAWSSVAQKKIRDTCRRLQNTAIQLPVFYEPSEFGVRWEMGQVNTNIRYMMVEFPVPQEEAEQAENEAAAPSN